MASSLAEEDAAQDGSVFDSFVEREDLLMQEIPIVVVTPAKVAQPLLESPSTITVLTREDIKLYGISSLSDILRNIPAVDVMSVSATDRNISVRGFNQISAGKILSLVDGRPIYMDLYGITPWELLPVPINEIERIEFVKGPGSALYGANAFDGVINIITNPMTAIGSTSMQVTLNQFGKLGGAIIHSGAIDKFNYRTSMGLSPISGWDDEEADAGENRNFNGSFQYNINDRSSIQISGGVTDYKGELLVPSDIKPLEYDGITDYIEAKYARLNLDCSMLWRRMLWNVGSQEAFSASQMITNIFDADLKHSFSFLERNFITWGLSYRFNWLDAEILAGEHNQNLFAGYIQDQIQLNRQLALTAGLRYDRHPLTGSNLSPRFGIVYLPLTKHALRASVGRAFRNPPFLYSYFSTSFEADIPMLPHPVTMKVLGNKELSPEWITSLEIGYRGSFGERAHVGVDMFRNKLRNLMFSDIAEAFEEDALYPGSPGGLFPSIITISNMLDARAWGGEITLDVSVNRWVSINTNYSYQHIANLETGEIIESAPKHKLNPGINLKLSKNFAVNLFANYVSGTAWDGKEIDSYILLNSVICYKIRGSEISLSAFNLLNSRHLEHPQGDEVGRSVILSLMHRI